MYIPAVIQSFFKPKPQEPVNKVPALPSPFAKPPTTVSPFDRPTAVEAEKRLTPAFKAAATFGNEILRPVTAPGSLLTPELEKRGVPASIAVAAGIGADLLAPTPGAKGRAFKGFTDLSSKILEKLKGKDFVNRQYIADLTNAPDIKQAEKELIRKVLDQHPGQRVDVNAFANRAKIEFLPLEVASKRTGGETARFESVTLPDEVRGPVADYNEHIYASPIKTSAGNVHFSDDVGAENYFAHTRVEDLPALDKVSPTRRVIEIQSDLFQKGRLEDEQFAYSGVSPRALKEGADGTQEAAEAIARDKAKLEPYRNTWHERVIREEVKQAAKDGKTKLQFPTGETAMKIEGLGESTNWNVIGEIGGQPAVRGRLHDAQLKVGTEITQQAGYNHIGESDKWIITDVLGDGKFKAVPKDTIERLQGQKINPDGTGFSIDTLGGGRIGFPTREMAEEELKRLNNLETYKEEFDISGNVDKDNPIYKFYEKDVQRYLKNKYGGKVITDPQGVNWIEIDVSPDQKKLPVEAFALAPLAIPTQDKEK